MYLSKQKEPHAPQSWLLFVIWITECMHMAWLNASIYEEHSNKNIFYNWHMQLTFYRKKYLDNAATKNTLTY